MHPHPACEPESVLEAQGVRLGGLAGDGMGPT
jgi:hypothetical protein